MRCIECGRFPFCEFIKNPQEKACEKNIKKSIGGMINEQRRSIKNSKR